MPARPLIPRSKITQLHAKVKTLSIAVEPADALAALFLVHCATKDCLEYIPEGEAAGQPAIQPDNAPQKL